MSEWRRDAGASPRSPTTDTPNSPNTESPTTRKLTADVDTPTSSRQSLDKYATASPTTPQRDRADSRASRPNSMLQAYQPPMMEVASDTIPELQPVFTFLNSHSNKLYQEGYFLKLHDLDSRGRPSTDRIWNECFAQLVGTVLSLWDAAALDAAGEDGEVVPTFINLSDASIKMIESLPMNVSDGGNLQNVLSISTAANNRYLLHFNSLNSLTQWTAGIRLAMFEHATLQEAYTGSLIAGKGKLLNNIRTIMERSRFKTEDWTRVRFGAGTPWRRCWCVISPPDEKEYQKAQKTLKKRQVYDRSTSVPKGDIKFYDTRKVTKKTKPIATISDAYAAYAIYPQSKPLIDQSTLVKMEGLVTIHTTPETTTEGFVFVMPEVHPAVTGFEMMLRWLFPVYDTFALYGRPNRLIADTLDQRGLMFAMPRERRYGYLDILDVSGLIHTTGSATWSERQWRKEMKQLTSQRMNTAGFEDVAGDNRISQRRNTISRTSLTLPRNGSVRFDDNGSSHSSPSTRRASPAPPNDQSPLDVPRRVGTAPPVGATGGVLGHKRSASDALNYKRYQTETPSRLSYEQGSRDDYEQGPSPPMHGFVPGRAPQSNADYVESPVSYEGNTFEPDVRVTRAQVALDDLHLQAAEPALVPVASPPAFTHSPNARPANRPYQAPELRRATSAIDAATLHQLADANRKESGDARDQAGATYPLGPDAEPKDVTYNSRDGRAGSYPRNEGLLSGRNEPRDPRQRLPTIPASPYINDSEFFTPHAAPVAIPPPVPEHSDMTRSVDNTSAAFAPEANGETLTRPSRPSPPPHSGSGHSVTRKPVPWQGLPPPSPTEPESPVSSVGSLPNHITDQDALDRLLQTSPDRRLSLSSSARDDDSVVSPDYASTKSASTKQSIEKPRAGVLKTVGNPEMPQRDQLDGPAAETRRYRTSTEVPKIDFGPTLAYRPDIPRVDTGGTITPTSQRAENASEQRGTSDQPTPPRSSPSDGYRESYYGGRSTPSPVGYDQGRSGSPLNAHASEENRRSMLWQPALSNLPAVQSNRLSLTPEQWVQHRAAIAAQPQQQARATPIYGHARQASGNMSPIRRASGTPPMSRTHSGDWTQQSPRTPPKEPNGRPSSRGAGAILNPPSPGGLLQSSQPSHLSAREQMHVARVTGSPLINLSGIKEQQKQQNANAPGLVGALAAREREKEAIKEGIRGGMVQQAIAARQQRVAHAEAEAQLQLQAQAHAQYQAYQLQQPQAYQQQQAMFVQQQQVTQNHRPELQQHRSSFYAPSQLHQNQGYPSPQAQVYAQTGGWVNSSVQQGYQSQQQTPQQAYGASYFANQGGQGQQRRT
ncbi:hypothetical protein LTR50_000558 [Elasticomyces elasticus]|nr:hypothetical protein LTR50_000558 [Elasticomyces elasticus]